VGDFQAASSGEPREWRHLSLDDLDLPVERFAPTRARYLQTMLDLEGKGAVQSKTLVHLEVDRAVHSGEWDGSEPVELRPFRGQGLTVDWKVQNPYYNAFDRVLTDRRLSTLMRQMPAGPYTLVVGSVVEDRHTLVRAAPGPEDTQVPVTRTDLPGGSINVLTGPYLLAALDLAPGERFTLPGHQPVGGPEGNGMRWWGAFVVESVAPRIIRGEEHLVATVTQKKIPRAERPSEEDLAVEPGERFTRLLVSSRPPYLLGRGDYLLMEDGREAAVREQLDVVDWAAIPLPAADLVGAEIWQLEEGAFPFLLAPEHTPEPVVPRG
jgi:hypothetical protein